MASDRFLIDLARAQLPRLPRWFAAAAPRFTAARVTEVEPCSGGGDLSVTLNDINNNQDLDVSESFTTVARSCVEFDATVNGTLGMQVTSLSGDVDSDHYQSGATTTLTNLSVTMPGGNAVGNGSIAMDLLGSGPGAGRTTLIFDRAGRRCALRHRARRIRALDRHRLAGCRTPGPAGTAVARRRPGAAAIGCQPVNGVRIAGTRGRGGPWLALAGAG